MLGERGKGAWGLFRHVHEVTLANTAAATAEPILHRMARYFVRLLKLWHLVEVTLVGWTYML